MNSKTIIFIGIFLTAFCVSAQKSNPINYINQTPPGRVAKIFAPGIVSSNTLEHSAPAFSPDGKTVVWTIMKMPSYQTCLQEMNLEDNKWSSPHSPSFSDTTANEVYPVFSSGGDTLFFSTNRKIDTASAYNNTLWYVIKTNAGWSQARPLDTNVFKKDIYASSFSGKGKPYFIVGPHGTPDWNIYTINNSGQAEPLPPHINSSGYEDGVFIAPDESYLIFESDRPAGGQTGNIDLYISFRKEDGAWAAPLNMGTSINSHFAERFAKVSPDGKYLFFGKNTGNGFDIYWIDAAVISELKIEAIKSGLLK